MEKGYNKTMNLRRRRRVVRWVNYGRTWKNGNRFDKYLADFLEEDGKKWRNSPVENGKNR